MTTIPSNLRRVLRREPRVRPSTEPVAAPPERVEAPPVEIAPNDPLIAYFSGATGAVDIGALQLDSPALEGLREAGIKLVVPLVSQGELIGLLNLGPRRSEQEYSADDRKLLDDLAGHAAPAVRVAQLVREQEAEVRQRERIEQELRVAQLIQQQFLPEELPDLPGWQFAAFYGPAREVGGDFYDFIELPEGQLGIVVGDVTDKGVPAALVMATTHSILRAEAPRLIAPSEVLTRVNNLLVDEMPAHMFVTCLYAVLDPETGRLRYANAGHNVPYVSTEGGVTELRATGMPARPAARDGVRGEGGDPRPRRHGPAPLRRAGRGPRHPAGDVRLPAGGLPDRRGLRRRGADRPAAQGAAGRSSAPRSSRRTTSPWSPWDGGPPAARPPRPPAPRHPRRRRAASWPPSRWPASPATSAWPSTRSPRRWPGWGWTAPAWSGSRRPSARRP